MIWHRAASLGREYSVALQRCSQADTMPHQRPPDVASDETPSPTTPAAPYGFWRTVVIVLCGHLGVRPAHKRREVFQRARGPYVFAVAVLYFALVIAGLIVLVNLIAPLGLQTALIQPIVANPPSRGAMATRRPRRCLQSAPQ